MKVTKAQKIDFLKQNYNIDKIKPPFITQKQYFEIGSVLLSSGWYKSGFVDKATIDNIISTAKNMNYKKPNAKGLRASVSLQNK